MIFNISFKIFYFNRKKNSNLVQQTFKTKGKIRTYSDDKPFCLGILITVSEEPNIWDLLNFLYITTVSSDFCLFVSLSWPSSERYFKKKQMEQVQMENRYLNNTKPNLDITHITIEGKKF